jgi:hypothetical protein
MILDLRIYTTKPGRTADWVALYKEHAWAIQQQYLGRCVACTTVVEGCVHQVVHIWAYDSEADRETRRAAMAADPAWAKYLAASAEAGYLVHQENRILKPTDFSPLK